MNVANDTNARVDTNNLEQEVTNLYSTTRYWSQMTDSHPYADYFVGINQGLINLTQGILDRMNIFIVESGENYTTVREYLELVKRGMDAIKNDYWDATTGTFNTSDMDTSWATDINNKYYKNILFKEGMSEEEYDHLNELGYTGQQIHETYMSFETEEDKKMFLLLASQEYEKAFAIDPDTLSTNMNAFIGDYAARVAIKDMSEAQEAKGEKVVPNIQKLMNALTMSEGEYENSHQFKHLKTITAVLSMDINSTAKDVYENGNYTEAGAYEAKYKANFYGLCEAAIYLNTLYDGRPKRSPTMESSPFVPAYLQTSTIYTLFGFNFDKLTYDGAFSFEASYESGYVFNKPNGGKDNLGKNKEGIEKTKVTVSNTSSFKAEVDYYKTLNSINKRKEELLDDFLLKGTSLLVGIWNPILGGAIVAATSIAKDENGKELVKYVMKGNKYVLSKEFDPIDAGKYRGLYGKGMLTTFDFMINGMDLASAYNTLDDEKKAAADTYLNFIYRRAVGKIEIGEDGNDEIFNGEFLDYNQMYALRQWSEKGLKELECKNEKLKEKLENLYYVPNNPTNRDKVIMELLDGGYDFTKLGGEGKYDLNVFIDAVSEINLLLSKDSNVEYDIFEDIIQPLGKSN